LPLAFASSYSTSTLANSQWQLWNVFRVALACAQSPLIAIYLTRSRLLLFPNVHMLVFVFAFVLVFAFAIVFVCVQIFTIRC